MQWCQWHRGQLIVCAWAIAVQLSEAPAVPCENLCWGQKGPWVHPRFYPLTPSMDRIRQCVKALSHTSLIWSSPPYPSEGTEQVLLSIPALARWGHRFSETEFIPSHELRARPCVKHVVRRYWKYMFCPQWVHIDVTQGLLMEHFFWYVEKNPTVLMNLKHIYLYLSSKCITYNIIKYMLVFL